MVTLDDAVIARYEKNGKHFEVLIEPENAMDFREGNAEKLDLATDEIFRDSAKGDRASEEILKEIFNTKDTIKIAQTIVKKGDIQLTTIQRRKMTQTKRKQVIAAIARNAINPQTKTPHPPSRIELAIEEAKLHFDPFKSTEEQVSTTLEALKPLIPIRFEKIKIAVKIPPEFAPKIYGELHSFGKLMKEDWLNDGSWAGIFEIPAGMQADFYDFVNGKTHGKAETRKIDNFK